MGRFIKLTVWCFLFTAGSLFLAAGTYAKSNYAELPAKQQVDAHHSFTITFSSELNPLTVHSDAIYVMQQSKKVDGFQVMMGSNAKSVKIAPPLNGYTAGGEYTIFVENRVQSADGVFLKRPVFMNFSVKSAQETAPGGTFHSKEAVQQKWQQYKPVFKGNPYVTAPHTAAPYRTGSMHQVFLQDGLKMTNFMRFLAGLPEDVVLQNALNAEAQYGAVVLAANGSLSHYPNRPENMDKSFYDIAAKVTAQSNLHYLLVKDLYFDAAGNDFIEKGTLAYSILDYMRDPGDSNLESVGHRRWVLSPKMKETGFGYASTSSTVYAGYTEAFTAMQVFDKGTAYEMDYTVWPSKGYFPIQFFDNGALPWSVHLHYENYKISNPSAVTVKLTRKNDGKAWSFNTNHRDKKGKYFTVNTLNYGHSTAIIFRPDNIQYKAGDVFIVEVLGVRSQNGNAKTIRYEVGFFDLLR